MHNREQLLPTTTYICMVLVRNNFKEREKLSITKTLIKIRSIGSYSCKDTRYFMNILDNTIYDHQPPSECNNLLDSVNTTYDLPFNASRI